MARISYTKYSNSILASIFSAIGALFKYFGLLILVLMVVYAFNSGFGEDAIGGLFAAGFILGNGFILEKCGEKISERKTYKLWLAFISKNGYNEAIKNNVEFAKAAYDKCPNKKCKKYVIKLNADVVKYIDN